MTFNCIYFSLSIISVQQAEQRIHISQIDNQKSARLSERGAPDPLQRLRNCLRYTEFIVQLRDDN